MTERQKTALSHHGIEIKNGVFSIGCRLKRKDIIYTSLSSTVTKSADFFLEMNDGSFGTAEFYFELNNKYFVFFNNFEVKYTHYHLKGVENMKTSAVLACDNIKRKVLFLKRTGIEYISDYSQNYGFMR